METQEQAWKKVKLRQKFENAFRGIYIFLKSTRNVGFYFVSSVAVVALGFYFEILAYEWLALVFAIGLVFTTEAFNTSIEIDIDLTSPSYHPYARDTKDVAAGAVLMSAIVAIIIGLIIFIPKVF